MYKNATYSRTTLWHMLERRCCCTTNYYIMALEKSDGSGHKSAWLRSLCRSDALGSDADKYTKVSWTTFELPLLLSSHVPWWTNAPLLPPCVKVSYCCYCFEYRSCWCKADFDTFEFQQTTIELNMRNETKGNAWSLLQCPEFTIEVLQQIGFITEKIIAQFADGIFSWIFIGWHQWLCTGAQHVV